MPVVLLSGGVDSTVCMSIACRRFGRANVEALTIKYGQRHLRESEAARAVADYYRVEHTEIILPKVFRDVLKDSGSLLMTDDPMIRGTYEEASDSRELPATYVPFRNGLMLSMAAAFAMSRGHDAVVYGAHAEDGSVWAYPDCTPEFSGSMASAIYLGTAGKVRLLTFLQWMSKADVVSEGYVRRAPLHLTWSCYEGGEVQCGECPTCVSRIKAFKDAGIVDPVGYRIDVDWRRCIEVNWG